MESSSFLTDTFEGVSPKFTDLQELSAQGYCRLLRAKRYGRWYVLKTLNVDKAQLTPYRQMLRKELEVLMQMQHPGVVQATGMEQVEGIGPCIVMEYIDGETLESFLEGSGQRFQALQTQHDSGQRFQALHRLPLPQRQEIARQLCDALAYVHSQGIVHRDLKPENIMLTRNGMRVKLIDFGMADTDQHAVLKHPAGTLSYMSPEQASQAVPDIRNDIYSLGLILQQLELGKLYHPVIDRCLKPIAQRYASVGELLADVDNRRKRRKQWKWASAAMVAIIGIAALAIAANNLQSSTFNLQSYRQAAAIDSLQRQLRQQQAESDKRQRESNEAQAAMQTQMSRNMATLSDSIRHLTDANTALQDELTRTDRAKAEALKALHKEIERSQIDRHLDTLSKWEYRWSDLSTRVADVSRFIYNYADGLADRNGDLSQQERDQVRQAMLDDWKQWSSKTVTLANSIRLKNNAAQPDSFPWHENKRPSTDL